MELRLEEPTDTWEGGHPGHTGVTGITQVCPHLHSSGVSRWVGPDLEQACLWHLFLTPISTSPALVDHHGLVCEQAQQVVRLFTLDHAHLHSPAPQLVIQLDGQDGRRRHLVLAGLRPLPWVSRVIDT